MPTPQVQNDPAYALPFLYVNGLNVSVSSDTALSISSGQCRDSNDIMDIVIGSAPINGPTATAPITLNTAVVGLNGIDAGVLEASKVYAVYAIGDSRYYEVPGVLLSLASNSAPTMPFGYDSYRLIGYAVTDASVHFLPAYVAGTGAWRVFAYDAPQATAVTAGNATSYTAVALTALVPPVDNLSTLIAYAFTPGAASRVLNITPGNATGNAVTITGQVTSVVISGNAQVMAKVTSAVPEVDYKVTNSGDAVAINVAGFSFSI